MMIRYQFTLYSISFGSLSRENRDYIHLELELELDLGVRTAMDAYVIIACWVALRDAMPIEMHTTFHIE